MTKIARAETSFMKQPIESCVERAYESQPISDNYTKIRPHRSEAACVLHQSHSLRPIFVVVVVFLLSVGVFFWFILTRVLLEPG